MNFHLTAPNTNNSCVHIMVAHMNDRNKDGSQKNCCMNCQQSITTPSASPAICLNDITILDTSEIDGNLDRVIHIFPMDRRHSQHNCVVAHLMVKQDWGNC